MTWTLDVRHVTHYEYESDVVASYNEARVTPQSRLHQVTLGARIDIDPPVRPSHYWDYWGTLVHVFDVHVSHRALTITASSIVHTPSVPALHPPSELTWADLDTDDVRDRFCEFLSLSGVASAGDGSIDAAAAAIRADAPSPADVIELASTWVRSQLVYEKGSTSVSTSALEAWAAGRGVCQDFVHLTLALVRAAGIPARYVSGYFHPDPASPIGAAVSGESHAWAEAWIGDWVPFDPTNNVPVGERHVVVARGREYRDVTPLKGIYSGAPPASPSVRVELTRRA